MIRPILILHCGGTIGMGPTAKGYATLTDFPERMRQRLSEQGGGQLPIFEILELHPLIDSSNLKPNDWLRIAHEIQSRWDDYEGFVLLHGTDTMAYSASALSFMFGRMDKPIIISGSQIPMVEPRSDALDNLMNSLMLANNSSINEVCICFNGRLLRGNRSSKVKSTHFDAFDSLGFPWLGETGIHIELRKDLLLKSEKPVWKKHHFIEGSVAILQFYPGVTHRVFSAVLDDPLVRALVIQSYGVGNGPDNDPELLKVISEAVARGVSIVNISRCPQGTVLPAAYATGSSLAETGVIAGRDLTVEAAYTKLLVLLGQGADSDAIREAMVKPWCGESQA